MNGPPSRICSLPAPSILSDDGEGRDGREAPDAGPTVTVTPDDLARACRILASEGLMENILGHVSARIGDNEMLLRCRGPEERGLRFTTPADIRRVPILTKGFDPGDGYSLPNEAPIHSETYLAREDICAVVHAHPPAVVISSIAGFELRPVFGSYNLPAMQLALSGVPTYGRSVLIRRPELGREMVAAMGDAEVCVLRGHGLVAAGATLERAVANALHVDCLARLTLAVAQAGRVAPDVPSSDLVEMPDLGSAFNDVALWRFHVAKESGSSSWP